MKNLSCIIFFLMFLGFSLQTQATSVKSELDSIFSALDSVLIKKDIYIKPKEDQIRNLKNLKKLPNITSEQEYELNRKIFDEYRLYMIDSAVVYAEKNEKISEILNDSLVNETRIELASTYTIAGRYVEAQRKLDQTPIQKLSTRLKVKYYDAYKQFFYHYAANPNSEENHRAYRDSLLLILEKSSNHYNIVYSDKLIDLKKYKEARELLIPLFSESEEGHWRAILAYTIGSTYRGEKNYNMQKKYFAISAISDIKSATKENASLLSLAISLYETDDIKRAHRYIQSSLDDAKFSKGHFRNMEIARNFPAIENLYQEKIASQKNTFLYLFVCIAVLSAFLVLILIFVFHQLKKISTIKQSLSAVNEKLNKANTDLQKANREMGEANKRLYESDLLKETYISQFLDMCSLCIAKMEDFQKKLNEKAKEGNLKELYNMLKSNSMVESELKELYITFDKAFLHIYPNFVEDFNQLLLPEERFDLNVNDLLNPELRIYALIRLGITDSSRIASFLRYSPATVYSYRTRVRSKSGISRKDFDNLVMKVGHISNMQRNNGSIN